MIAPNSRNFFVPSSGSLAGPWLAGWRRRDGGRGQGRGGRREGEDSIVPCSAVPGYILHRVTPVHVPSFVRRPPPRRPTPMKGEQSVMNRIAVHVWTTDGHGQRWRRLPTDFAQRDTHSENEYECRLPPRATSFRSVALSSTLLPTWHPAGRLSRKGILIESRHRLILLQTRTKTLWLRDNEPSGCDGLPAGPDCGTNYSHTSHVSFTYYSK